MHQGMYILIFKTLEAVNIFLEIDEKVLIFSQYTYFVINFQLV